LVAFPDVEHVLQRSGGTVEGFVADARHSRVKGRRYTAHSFSIFRAAVQVRRAEVHHQDHALVRPGEIQAGAGAPPRASGHHLNAVDARDLLDVGDGQPRVILLRKELWVTHGDGDRQHAEWSTHVRTLLSLEGRSLFLFFGTWLVVRQEFVDELLQPRADQVAG